MHIGMDKRIRVPFYGTISLFIETLTGTYFKIHVLPSETILSIKAKIQRLEGIPISQQHLIWEGHELDDKMCLHEYRIPRDASIKLVTTLRGGPINTRKITTNDSSDYFDLSEDELFDELPFTPGSNDSDSQVTLLVYRNGDQINFFRVMDCGGKITPVPYHFKRQNSESKPPSGVTRPRVTMSRIKENQVTAAKMKKLQNRFKLMRLKDNTDTENTDAVPENPALSNQELTAELSDSACGTSKSGLTLDSLRNDRSDDNSWKTTTAARRASDSEKPRSSHEVSPKVSFNRHEMYLRSYGLLPRNMDSLNGDEDKELDARTNLLPLNAIDNPSAISRLETNDETSVSASNNARVTLREIASGRGPKTLNKKEHFALGRGGEVTALQEGHTKLPMISTHSSLTATFPSVSGIMSRSSSRNSKGLGIESTLKAGLTSKFGDQSSMTFNHSRKHCPLPLDTDDRLQLQRGEGRKGSLQSEAMIPFPPSQSAILPPVRPFVIKKKRCFLCGKKTGLASSYICRCGENFCASHRYAEAHACTFDYKANGRQVLKEANPVISSRKLPKI